MLTSTEKILDLAPCHCSSGVPGQVPRMLRHTTQLVMRRVFLAVFVARDHTFAVSMEIGVDAESATSCSTEAYEWRGLWIILFAKNFKSWLLSANKELSLERWKKGARTQINLPRTACLQDQR